MNSENLQLSYECLNAIGNTLDLDSMISEILITFSAQTQAFCASFYNNLSDPKPSISIGKQIEIHLPLQDILDKEYFIFHTKECQHIALVLRSSCILFSYVPQAKHIKKYAKIFNSFRNKIIISINACDGVQQLEELNEELEERVAAGIQKIREHEQMLLLKSKQAVMGEMIEMIAHQWRQPITAIGMISNNLLFDLALGETNFNTIENELNDINSQVEYLSHTIDDFRNFFKQSKEKELFELDILLEKTITLVKKQFLKKGIELKIHNKCHIALFSFKNELIQVILNLLSNSKEAFDDTESKKKKLTIRCTSDKEHAILQISDNAGGIPEEILPRIFDPYFSTKIEKNGSGLGLYMSKIIIHEHLRGKISVRNISDGCEFSIQIPIVQEVAND